MKIIFISSVFILSCNLMLPQHSRMEEIQNIKSNRMLVFTEVEKDLYKIENKITGDTFFEDLSKKARYYTEENIDSMIIEIFSIDTSLYFDMYLYWQSMDISNGVNGLLINDFNSNTLPELYGNRTIYNSTALSPGVFELNESGSGFYKIFEYPDTVMTPKGFYDINNDGLMELLLKKRGGLGGAIFYTQLSDTSLPALQYFAYPKTDNIQVMSPRFGDFDDNGLTDFAYTALGKTLYIAEFHPAITNFDSVYSFISVNTVGGITVGDFDLDSKTDIVTSNIYGDVHLIEAQGDNDYVNVWNGQVQVGNAYYSFATNDIDKNGKPEFWVGGKHFTTGILLTCFEYVSNNSYEPKYKILIPDYYTLNPLTTFADDIDGDGEVEIIICADYFLLILKFSGSPDNHQYKIWYFNLRDFSEGETWTVTAYDLNNDGKKELFFDTYTQMDSMGQSYWKSVNHLYKPTYTVDVKEQIKNNAHEFHLYSNYPNPFNPSTNVKFKLAKSENTSVKIYNTLGKEIKLLLEENLPAGEYTIQWDGKDEKGNSLPGGVYFIQMTAGEYQQTIKSVLLK